MAAWPSDTDFKDFAVASGSTLTDAALNAFYDGFSDSLLAEVARITGWNPLVAGDSFTDRYFDAPGPHTQNGLQIWHGGGNRLILDAAMLELNEDQQIVTIGDDGQVMKEYTKGSDFELNPYNFGYYTSVHFRRPMRSYDGRVKINAKWGRFAADDVPADMVREAKRVAFARATQNSAISVVGAGLSGREMADMKESYGASGVVAMNNEAEAKWTAILMSYLRLNVV